MVWQFCNGDLNPYGGMALFAQIAAPSMDECPGGIGLTAALVVLRGGWVIVGSLPTRDGSLMERPRPLVGKLR